MMYKNLRNLFVCSLCFGGGALSGLVFGAYSAYNLSIDLLKKQGRLGESMADVFSAEARILLTESKYGLYSCLKSPIECYQGNSLSP